MQTKPAGSASKRAPVKRPLTTRKPVASKPQDAIALLRADHALVINLFGEYERTRFPWRGKVIAAQICTELTIHMQIEEEIFYPAVKEALRDKGLVPEATVEHATIKELIAQIQDKESDSEMYDAKMKVLSEYVKHHVKEEQTEMFPKVKATKLDMNELGARMAARKAELKPAKSAAKKTTGPLARMSDALQPA